MKIENNINYKKVVKPKKKLILFFVLAVLVVSAFIANKKIQTKGYSGLFDFFTTVLSNYKSSWSANPEVISIEIKDKDFKKLEKNRKQALERGVIINDLDGDYVDGVLNYDGKRISIKLRLKGHMTDHLQNDKWSFRIKVKEKDETFMGMKRFTIQHPGTRGYIYEWIYHELMKREDVIALRYKFIKVNVNDEDWGIYAVEENFESELVENNGRPKGPILRFNPDLYWVNRYNQYTRSASFDEFSSYYSANPEAYREEKVLSDSVQKHYYLKAIATIEGLKNSKLNVDDVFDIPRLAKFHAIIDLVGGVHSIDWSDIKYYYNPVTAKLEPVAYESFTNLQSRDISSQYLFVSIDSSQNYSVWHEMIFSNPVFFKEYIKNLERISNPDYLDTFFDNSNAELKTNLAIIYKEFPYKKFDKNDYYKRQKQIHKVLNPPKAIHAYLNKVENNKAFIQIATIEALPVLVHSIELNGKAFPASSEITIASKSHGKALVYNEYSFDFESSSFEKNWKDSLKINYSILGASEIKQTKIFPFPHTDSEFISEELKNKKSTVSDFSFLKVDESTKSIFINAGNHIVDKDLILPETYTVYAQFGTAIDLKKGAKIISYSPFLFTGTEDNAIVITSSDSSSQGVVFINATKSVFKHVVFRNFENVKDAQWKRSGAITFYESLVDMFSCSFYNFKSEDAVNMIRSNFLLKGCLFQNMKDDALDADFSKGIIDNCSFENCKENAIDATKSNLEIKSSYINGSKNKGLNSKDGSEMMISDLTIKNCYIAISAEDFSNVEIKKSAITNSEIGVVSYKNKPSAGYAKVTLTSVSIKDVKTPYLKEKKSSIVVNDKEWAEEVEDVELIIKKKRK